MPHIYFYMSISSFCQGGIDIKIYFMDLQSIFVNNLKRIRKEKKLTQAMLAEMCGTDTSYISQIEIKRRFPSVALIERISTALDIEPYILFLGKEKDSVSQKKVRKSSELVISKIKKDLLNKVNANIESVLRRYLV